MHAVHVALKAAAQGSTTPGLAISTLLFDPESAIKKKLQFLTCRIMTYSALIKKSSRNNTLNFEIHNFFANAFESTLPLPKVQDLSQLRRSHDVLLFHLPLAPVPASITSQTAFYTLRISMLILKSK